MPPAHPSGRHPRVGAATRPILGPEVVHVPDTERTTPDAQDGAEPVAPPSLAERVHVDLPRVRPEDMVTTQEVDPAPDPRGGRDTETEFMLRHAGP